MTARRRKGEALYRHHVYKARLDSTRKVNKITVGEKQPRIIDEREERIVLFYRQRKRKNSVFTCSAIEQPNSKILPEAGGFEAIRLNTYSGKAQDNSFFETAANAMPVENYYDRFRQFNCTFIISIKLNFEHV